MQRVFATLVALVFTGFSIASEKGQILGFQTYFRPQHSDMHLADLRAIWAWGICLIVFWDWLECLPRLRTFFAKNGFRHPGDFVPHCAFRETSDGFVVTLRNKSSDNASLAGVCMVIFGAGLGGAYLYEGKMSDTLEELTIIALAICFLLRYRAPITITVGRDRIQVGRTNLNRSEFGGFYGQNKMGYWYGSRTYKFGGDWRAQEGYEIVFAMNYLMNREPAGSRVDDVLETLRSRRPSDF